MDYRRRILFSEVSGTPIDQEYSLPPGPIGYGKTRKVCPETNSVGAALDFWNDEAGDSRPTIILFRRRVHTRDLQWYGS
jgi:hypothetical protein